MKEFRIAVAIEANSYIYYLNIVHIFSLYSAELIQNFWIALFI